MLRLDTTMHTDPRLPLSAPELGDIFDGLADVFGLADWAVDLRIVDDRESARLNREFMGCLGPTNILSWPSGAPDEPDGQPVYLGDLALSAETARREAELYGQEPTEHLARLLAHGLLHLAGFDHGEAMDALTDQALAAVRDLF